MLKPFTRSTTIPNAKLSSLPASAGFILMSPPPPVTPTIARGADVTWRDSVSRLSTDRPYEPAAARCLDQQARDEHENSRTSAAIAIGGANALVTLFVSGSIADLI